MVVHPCSHRVSRVRRYSGYSLPVFSFAYGTLTLCGGPSQTLLLDTSGHDASPNPDDPEGPSVWPPPLSLATTRGISFDFSSSGYLDVSLPRVPRVRLCVQRTLRDSSSRVFPHSDISGSSLICSSPKLFAACHVLRRLPMPRHSPYALLSLNYLPYFRTARSLA